MLKFHAETNDVHYAFKDWTVFKNVWAVFKGFIDDFFESVERCDSKSRGDGVCFITDFTDSSQ